MTTPSESAPLLVLDSGSPTVSVAVGTIRDGKAASRSIEIAHSSEAILRLVDEALREAGVSPGDLGGLVGLVGPGSFTGLRVGMSTLLGLHQALEIPATGLPTLDVLALAAYGAEGPVLAAVDALRGEWFTRLYGSSRADDTPQLRDPEAIAALRPGAVVAHHVDRLASRLPETIDSIAAPQLAPLAFRLLERGAADWSAAALLDPLYLRPPAATAPR